MKLLKNIMLKLFVLLHCTHVKCIIYTFKLEFICHKLKTAKENVLMYVYIKLVHVYFYFPLFEDIVFTCYKCLNTSM